MVQRISTDPHQNPLLFKTITQPQKTTITWKPKRKDTQIPQPNDPIENVADEAVYKELGDSLVRAATTASSLEAGGRTSGNTLRSDEDRLNFDWKNFDGTNGRISATDADEEITLVSVQNVDEEMFDVIVLMREEVCFVLKQELLKCFSDEPLAIPLDEIQIDDKLNFIKEPVEIMDRKVRRLKQSRIPIVKVHWNSQRGTEFTWEREDQMQKKYPHLFANPTSMSKATS
ncbi:hypothetical protein Tco_1166064 [Tanacetum coccineum]